MLKGSLIYLNSIEKEDLGQLVYWRNEPNLRVYFREIREISLSDQLEWYYKLKHRNEFFFAIRLLHTNELIGVIGLNYINWINRNAQLSLYIGKELLYIDEYGWAKEATILIQNYAFNVLNLHKILIEVYEFDLKKKDLSISLEYELEGVLKEQVFANGRFYETYIFSKIKEIN